MQVWDSDEEAEMVALQARMRARKVETVSISTMICGIYKLPFLCFTAGLTTVALVNYFMWQQDFENTASPPYGNFVLL